VENGISGKTVQALNDELRTAEALLAAAEVALAENGRLRAENEITRQRLGSDYFVKLAARTGARRAVAELRAALKEAVIAAATPKETKAEKEAREIVERVAELKRKYVNDDGSIGYKEQAAPPRGEHDW
jgi:regulator of replication initiation timing